MKRMVSGHRAVVAAAALLGLLFLALFLTGCAQTRDEQYYQAMVTEEAALKIVRAGLQANAFTDAERIHIGQLVETMQVAREQFKASLFDLEQPAPFVYLDVLERIAFQLQQYGDKAKARGVKP